MLCNLAKTYQVWPLIKTLYYKKCLQPTELAKKKDKYINSTNKRSRTHLKKKNILLK